MVKSAMALFLVLLATARLVVEPVEALGCNDLAPAVVQCAPYALGNVAQPSAGCCNELQRVKGMASTTADRRQMCSCLKQYAPRFPNVKEAALAALPQRVMIFLHEYAGYPK
ncbi:hypothetical protein RJ639_022906, partial [Escallonia herrerae]